MDDSRVCRCLSRRSTICDMNIGTLRRLPRVPSLLGISRIKFNRRRPGYDLTGPATPPVGLQDSWQMLRENTR